jgi:hypothetical protein
MGRRFIGWPRPLEFVALATLPRDPTGLATVPLGTLPSGACVMIQRPAHRLDDSSRPRREIESAAMTATGPHQSSRPDGPGSA